MIALKNKSGSALFIVLGCVALMTLLVVAFLGATLTERSTSNFYAKEVNSKLLAETAVNTVLAQIRTGTKSVNPSGTSGIAWASQPGMIRTYNSNGNPDGFYKLYSASDMIGTGAYSGTVMTEDTPDPNWATEGDLYTDLNEPVNSHNPIVSAYDANGNPLQSMTVAGHTGVLTYHSTGGINPDIEGFYVDPATTPPGSQDNQVPMPVKWIYILSDGTEVIPSASSSGSGVTFGSGPGAPSVANPIVGRIAFWTDDETGKVNINTASEGSNWDVPLTQAPEDYGTYAGNNATFAAPYGMATAVPAGGEYQRIPGHPATTCLSTVFGAILPVPSGGFAESDYNAEIAPYFTLTPRYAPGGSKAGTRASFNSADNNYDAEGFLIPPAYRLYTSPDELMFDPQRQPISTTANGNVYADSSNGISPVGGRPQIPAMTQNFFNETLFFLTANSKAPEETLFDTPRISLWPLQTDVTNARNAKDKLLAFCATINGNPYYFQRSGYYNSSTAAAPAAFGPSGSASGSSQDMVMDMGGVTSSATGSLTPGSPDATTTYSGTNTQRNQNLLAYLRALTSADGTTRNIPGFGSNFMVKYPAPPSGNSASDLDQILVDMFDYIRSSVNTYSLGYTPQYTYSPMPLSGGNGAGCGSSLPIQVNIGGHIVSGLGRTTTIGEVALVFMPAAFLDQTTLGVSTSVPPFQPVGSAASPKPDGLPDDVADSNGNYDGIGDFQTTAMRAFIVIKPISVMPSTTTTNPNLRYSVAGLDSFAVDFLGGNNPVMTGSAVWTNLGFPSGGSIPGGVTPGSNNGSSAVDLLSTTTYGGRSPIEFAYWPLMAPIPNTIANQNIYTATHRIQGPSNGDIPSTRNTGNDLVYPFAGGIVPLPINHPANPSAWSLDGVTNLHPGMRPSTFAFNGGEICITVSSGFPTKGSTAPVTQTVHMYFPPILSLPVPFYTRVNKDDQGYGNGIDGGLNGPIAYQGYANPFTDTTKLEWYTQNHFGTYNPTSAPAPTYNTNDGDTGFFPNRIGNQTVNGTSTNINYEALIQRGDTVRSLVLNPDCQAVRCDARLVANMSVVPLEINSDYVYTYLGIDAAYDSHGIMQYNANSVYNDNYNQFHSLYYDYGNFYDYETRTLSALNPSTPDITAVAPINWANYPKGGGPNPNGAAGTAQFGFGQGTYGGSLFSGATYSSNVQPLVSPEMTAAYMDKGTSHTLAGDWTTGTGNTPDGPMVTTPDEGYQNQNGTGYSSGYYETWGGVVAGAASTFTSESFSPNRQIASGVMFGTLPACVQSGQPWRTLLFCPNPATGSLQNHPGFGSVTAGVTAGPSDVPPYVSPPDHLFLDLFWMPIVEPYAISEPFSTAGKVNMNYQIVPFSYIHRSTAVRAVLKSVGLIALPAAASQKQGVTGIQYKSTSYHFAAVNTAANDHFRYNINLDETIDAADSGFQTRFATNDIFRSASEICNIFLVPQAITGNTYQSAPVPPPVDYASTRAWWDHFPLTGDNAREAPYNKLYPRLTTKSNTFQVHFRVQTLVKNQGPGSLSTVFDTTKGDSVASEYRGSSIIERYIDPNDPNLPDFAAGIKSFTQAGTTLDNYYRYRIVRSKSFTP